MAIICLLLQLYALVVIARAIVSWFSAETGPLAAVKRVLWQLTEPLLAPLRRVLPPVRTGGIGIDLGPVILLVAIWLLATLVCALA